MRGVWSGRHDLLDIVHGKESLAAVVLPEPLIGVGLLDNGDDAIGYEREVISVKVACPEGFALDEGGEAQMLANLLFLSRVVPFQEARVHSQ